MSGVDAQLRALVEAVTIESAGLARVVDVRGGVRDVSVANERGPFLGLAEALYSGHYNMRREPGPSTGDDAEVFLNALRAANRLPQRFAAGAPLPREGITGQGGHYVMFGRAMTLAQTGRQVRFYWNLPPAGAAPFVGAVTERLERMRIPFQAKVPVHPAGYERSDSGVLYLGDDDLAVACDAIEDVHAAVRPLLRDGVPLFALPLGRGVGFAESPPSGDSFGMHRCDLIAEGMVRAFERGAHSVDERTQIVRERLTAYGFDLERFAFNPTARYPYRFPRLEEDAA